MISDVTVCVEVGASSVETVLLGPGTDVRVVDGAHDLAPDAPLLIAVPGLIEGTRVVSASNLMWFDVDPAQELGMRAPADLLSNDAEAAAFGESALRPGCPDLVFLGLGTGVGGAVVLGDAIEANLFAHRTGFGQRICSCTQTGCLETVAGGWALPGALESDDLAGIAAALARAIDAEDLAVPRLVVLAGGVSRAYPALVDLLQARLPDRVIEPSIAIGTKSATAWGLRLQWQRQLAGLPSAVVQHA